MVTTDARDGEPQKISVRRQAIGSTTIWRKKSKTAGSGFAWRWLTHRAGIEKQAAR